MPPPAGGCRQRNTRQETHDDRDVADPDPPDRPVAGGGGGLAHRVRGTAATGRPHHQPRRRHPRADERAAHHRAVRPAPAGTHRARHRPPRLLVLPPARVAQEGRADERHVPAQQPLHLSVDGEAQRLRRPDAPGAEGSRDLAGALQEPGRQLALGLHLGEVQPVVRPQGHRQPARLPDVHEALRRGRLARRVTHQRRGRPRQGLRRVGRDAHAPPVDRRVRAFRPGTVDRPGDDGDGLPARTADAQPVRRDAQLPQPVRRQADGRDQPHRERHVRLGVQLVRNARRR